MSESAMRAYLLGQATDVEAAHLEARLLDDQEIFDTLRSVEDDLFDAYARGTLTEAERASFLKRYGTERSRLLMAHALARRTAPGRVLLFRRLEGRQWLSLAAAAALLLTVGLTAWLRTRPTIDSAAPEIASRDAAAQSGQSAAQTPATTSQPAINPAVLILTLATSRSATSSPAEAKTTTATPIELRVRLHPEDQFDRYVMTLRSSVDRVAWTDDDPEVVVAGADRFLVSTVPASAVETGIYELSVRAAKTGSPPETLGFVDVSIQR